MFISKKVFVKSDGRLETAVEYEKSEVHQILCTQTCGLKLSSDPSSAVVDGILKSGVCQRVEPWWAASEPAPILL